MNLDKAQLKIAVANNLGADMEDRLEGEMKAAHELAGAAQALRQVAKKVPADLIARLEADQEEGDKAIKDGLEAHLVVQIIKQWLTRAGDYLAHMADVEQQKAVAQGGRASGLQDAMKLVKKMKDEETQKIQTFMELATKGEEAGVLTAPRTAGEAARLEHGKAADRKEAEELPVKAPAAPEKPKRKGRKSRA
jgi:hypothetical protein